MCSGFFLRRFFALVSIFSLSLHLVRAPTMETDSHGRPKKESRKGDGDGVAEGGREGRERLSDERREGRERPLDCGREGRSC